MAPRAHSGQTQRNAGPPAVSLILESAPSSTSEAAQRVIELAKKLDYTEEQCHDIELAVREVVANAVLHGNRSDVGKRIFLSAAAEPSGLVIRCRDEGQGFDPASVPDPRLDDALSQESGRGLFLMKASMDKVSWRRSPDGGTEVILTKFPAHGRPAPPRNGAKRRPSA